MIGDYVDIGDNYIFEDWRFERKFFITSLSRYDIENIIKFHPALFVEAYASRNINNIYLDTYSHTNFFKNVDGQSQRLKIRVRWYGDMFGEIEAPVLELKIKNGQLGRKVSFKLKDFEFNKKFSNLVLKQVFSESDIPDDVKELLKDFNATLVNRYKRKYYQTVDKKFRLTSDSNMEYIKLLSNHRASFGQKVKDRMNGILELKYSKENDMAANAISNQFPFRMTKSSKYVTGIELFLSSLK